MVFVFWLDTTNTFLHRITISEMKEMIQGSLALTKETFVVSSHLKDLSLVPFSPTCHVDLQYEPETRSLTNLPSFFVFVFPRSPFLPSHHTDLLRTNCFTSIKHINLLSIYPKQCLFHYNRIVHSIVFLILGFINFH